VVCLVAGILRGLVLYILYISLLCMQRWWVSIPLLCLIALHFCARSKPGPCFLSSYVVVYFACNNLRLDVIVRFGGIVDNHFLYFIFMNKAK
jgi:hypothetical protein